MNLTTSALAQPRCFSLSVIDRLFDPLTHHWIGTGLCLIQEIAAGVRLLRSVYVAGGFDGRRALVAITVYI